MSKLLNSRDEWKNKATERAAELRELRKTQKRHLKKIAELKRNNCQLEQLVEAKKHYLRASVNPSNPGYCCCTREYFNGY
ncbi:hypothetical protein [Methylotuvimicrobium alcaliphilum]